MANLEHHSIPESMSMGTPAISTVPSTWPERLLMNLISYSTVILPIALIVIATKFRLFPISVRSSALIQRFVNGSSETEESSISNECDDSKLLLDDKAGKAFVQQQRQKPSSTGNALEFIFCLLGLQVSYLLWGLLQEKIMTTRYLVTYRKDNGTHQDLTNNSHSGSNIQSDLWVTFHDSQFLVLINRLVAFITAVLALVYTQRRKLKIHASRYANGGTSTLHLARTSTLANESKSPQAPLYKYIYCSLSNILSSWCQYEALKYVNFPTQCLSKSCKVIPTMLMSKIMLRKRHPARDYFCALLLATGMFVFMLNQQTSIANSDHKPSSNHKSYEHPVESKVRVHSGNSAMLSGLVILSLYLTFDSFTSNWQQSLYSQYDISNWQMMAAINFYSILLTLTSLHQLGSLRPAFHLLASSSSLMRDCLVMSLTSSVGQIFVYHTIKRFGSVLFSVIMTLRQFLSILLSCIIYKHEITFGSSLGLVLVLMVVAYQTWLKTPTNKARGNRGTGAQEARATELSSGATNNLGKRTPF